MMYINIFKNKENLSEIVELTTLWKKHVEAGFYIFLIIIYKIIGLSEFLKLLNTFRFLSQKCPRNHVD